MTGPVLPEETPYIGERHSLESEPLREMYRSMALIRAFEERILHLFGRAKLSGTTHTAIGQEACAVGVLANSHEDDIVVSNHRCHGHFLARNRDAKGLLHELLGLSSGVCGGIGGSQHLHVPGFYSNGVLGQTSALAAGLAKGLKLKGKSAATILFVGDGAFGEGTLYESLNLASIWKLPLLVVVENNYYAQSTPSYLQLSGSFEGRAAAFSIPSITLTSSDVRIVAAAARELLPQVRSGAGPAMLILNTYRFMPHSKGDEIRDPAEIAAWRIRDPLLIDYGLSDAPTLRDEAYAIVDREIRTAVGDDALE